MLWFKFKHDCEKHGHYYEARYNQEVPDPSANAGYLNIQNCSFQATANLTGSPVPLKKLEYVADVCRYCGDTLDLLAQRLNPLRVTSNPSITLVQEDEE